MYWAYKLASQRFYPHATLSGASSVLTNKTTSDEALEFLLFYCSGLTFKFRLPERFLL